MGGTRGLCYTSLMPLSPQHCSNLRLQLLDLHHDREVVLELFKKIHLTGSKEDFIAIKEAYSSLQSKITKLEEESVSKAWRFLKTIEGQYEIHDFDLIPTTPVEYTKRLKAANVEIRSDLLNKIPTLK